MSKRKRKLRRTVTNPLRTVTNIRTWMRDNAEPEPSWDKHGRMKPKKWTRKELDETVLWWFANWQAQEWCGLRAKDIADILLTGLKPLTFADLAEELASAHESEDESEPAAQQIEAHLRAHFGLLTEEQDDE